MKTVEVLQEEHSAALVVVDQLERAAEAAENGVPVPTDVFADILEFMQVFVDRCHHAKEEGELFPRLRVSSGSALAERLQAEHEQGRALAATYADAVHSYVPGEAGTGALLRQTAYDYADFLRGHIATETAELLPAIEEALESDDDRLMAAFDQLELDQLGPGTHERFHSMIDSLAIRVDRWANAPAVSAC